MSETKKIKVKSAEAADPRLVVVLESADGGTFPPCVQVQAVMANPRNGGLYTGLGTITSGGAEQEARIVVSIDDPDYNSANAPDYELDVRFSENNVHWTSLPHENVEGRKGTAIPMP